MIQDDVMCPCTGKKPTNKTLYQNMLTHTCQKNNLDNVKEFKETSE